jgi:hypothetical protein
LDGHASDFGSIATLKSWKEGYVGQAAQALLKTMDKYYDDHDDRYYAKYITIVQSSGMGKSRMVDELSKVVLVIPVNLREPTTNGVSSSPPMKPIVEVCRLKQRVPST